MQQAEDFRAESVALGALLSAAPLDAFDEPTQFKDWTINDVMRHLHFWNRMAFFQLENEAALERHLAAMAASGKPMREYERAELGDIAGEALVAAWAAQVTRTADAFAQADPKARLKWAGPDMSARSSITARLMETWGHGQEIYDHLGVVRQSEDRIQNIIVLGVNTFSWTYKTRREPVPEAMPFLMLTSPSGAVWTFGEPSHTERIEGPAEAFCQVVTQTRNIADVPLKVTGSVAADWMAKAQCFAGPPNPPPAPRTRFARIPNATRT